MKNLVRLFALCILASAAGAFAPGAAHAQEQRPSFSLPSIIAPEDMESLTIDFHDAFNSIENDYLADTMKLNYQMSLLDKMIQRQSELAKITESYAALGVPFDEPPPPRGICEQLPANAPCLKYYPELYDALVSERRAHYEELEAKARAAALARNPEAAAAAAAANDPEAAARARKAEAERKARIAAQERKDRYRWSDVTCLAGTCRGVIVKPSAPGYQVSVRTGSRLPDGTTVQDVSRAGIRISIAGDVIQLRPVPSEYDNASGGAGGQGIDGAANPIGNALARAGVGTGEVDMGTSTGGRSDMGNAQNSAASVIGGITGDFGGGVDAAPGAEEAARAAAAARAGGGGVQTVGTTAGSATMAEPPLGPSGLF